jgi:hypothetical protein
MQRGPLFRAILLAAASAALARELVTRHGVGPIEYAVGAGVLAALVLATVSVSRRAFRRV